MNKRPHNQLSAEKFTLLDPRTGLPRAVLETAPARGPEPSEMAVVRLSLLTPDGRVALAFEVDETGQPRIFVGPPDRGDAVVVSDSGVDIWAGGNIVATLSGREGGPEWTNSRSTRPSRPSPLFSRPPSGRIPMGDRGSWPTWSPIETAPRDGTEILLYGGGMVVIAGWISGRWHHKAGQKLDMQPVMWMPLPDPPSDVARRIADHLGLPDGD